MKPDKKITIKLPDLDAPSDPREQIIYCAKRGCRKEAPLNQYISIGIIDSIYGKFDINVNLCNEHYAEFMNSYIKTVPENV
ncbi:MAG: hypothetical protein JSV20_08330 [Candidatus Bathyarchaeota archaeon]|nr:MAG: hypothetical protein JSV20_08330 [Candidatus Bathyarchaeota archaeon]